MRAGIEAGLRDTPPRPYSWCEAQERHFQWLVALSFAI
jgi:hypothetical protein